MILPWSRKKHPQHATLHSLNTHQISMAPDSLHFQSEVSQTTPTPLLPNVKSTLLVDPAGQKPNTLDPDLVK